MHKTFERSWQFPNRMGAMNAAAKEVFDWLSSLPLSSRAKYSGGLAIEEMASNIIKYGYDDDREHLIHIHLRIEGNTLKIVFEDDGHPFDPTAAPVPDIERLVQSRTAGGLGIQLVRRISEKMIYQRVGGVNRLTLHICRHDAKDTQLICLN